MIDLAELRHIFDRAAALPATSRHAFLEEACRGNAALRREIDRLLTASVEAGSVFDTLPLGEGTDSSHESSGILTASLAPGTRLGPYEIIAPLAAGGVGEVYAACDTRLHRNVAIKVLRQELMSAPDRLKRFEQEARAASALNHPNIITIYDFGQEGRTPYIAMEQVEGTSLRSMLCGRPLPIREVLQISRQIAEGLTKAHAAGIIHRDLKPENVMVTEDGHVKILDFGLAKLTASAPGRMLNEASTALATASGIVMGTAGYMSPEQAAGHHVDHRSDQFALGLILYEMTTGNRAFRRASAAQTLAAIIDEEPEPLVSLNPDVPPALSAVVARCLCKSRQERYESTRDLARELTTILESGSTPVRKTQRSSGIAASSAAVVMLVIAASASAWLVHGPSAVQDPEVRAQPTLIVAVLPFKNLSGDVSQAYFAAGMTEEIRNQLSKLAAFRLLSRSATERFGDGDVRRLASELSAARVIEGSVRLDRDRVRIGVAVIDARNDQMIWSDRFERTLDDVFALQGDIALQIAAALKVTLSPDERQRLKRSPTDNAEAYQLYLRTYDLAQGNRTQNIHAVEMLATAVHLDPRFALAQARMAYYLLWRSLYDGRHHLDNSIESSRKALAIDPTLAYSHSVLASALTLRGQAVEARLGYLKALQLDPSDATNMAMANLSVLEAEVLGRHDEALYWARRSLRLDHNRGVAYYHVGLPLLFLREDDLTEHWLNAAQSRFPDTKRIQLLRILLQYMRGNDSAAVALAREAVAADPGREEFAIVLAELSFLTNAPDAEALVEPYVRRAQEVTAQWRLKPETFRTVYAYLLARRGEKARASVLLEDALNHARQALAEKNESQRIPIEIAAIHAARQERDAALEWLDRGYDAGYRDYETIGRDPMFEPLRNEPKFQRIRERMRQDVAAMRARSADLQELRTQVSATTPATR